MAKQNKTNTKTTSTDALLSLPVTNSPRGLSILAQKLSAVLGKPISVEGQGKSWLKLVGLDKDDHEALYNIAPQVCAEMDTITRWIKGKDNTIMAYCMGPAMSEEIRNKRGLSVDSETRVVSVDLALYLGNEATRAAEKAQKAAERASKPKKINTKDALAEMLGVLLEVKADLDATKSELADLKRKPATGKGRA